MAPFCSLSFFFRSSFLFLNTSLLLGLKQLFDLSASLLTSLFFGNLNFFHLPLFFLGQPCFVDMYFLDHLIGIGYSLELCWHFGLFQGLCGHFSFRLLERHGLDDLACLGFDWIVHWQFLWSWWSLGPPQLAPRRRWFRFLFYSRGTQLGENQLEKPKWMTFLVFFKIRPMH